MPNPLRILLADDHILMRKGLRLLLEQQADFLVAAEADDGRAAVRCADEMPLDCVILDISMPLLNGIEAAQQIHDAHPDLPIIMLSMHSDEAYVLRALKSGAKAYLLKNSAEADIVGAIHAVTAGKSFFSPAVSHILLTDYVRKLERSGAQDSYELLSPREREVFQLVAEGNSTKEIASVLHLSAYTIDTHRAHIMEKLSLKGIPELILYAVRKGIIQ